MKNPTRKQHGIGLIEIMVALVIVAVGILGIAKLQKNVVRSASDANARAIAAVIAQNKVDELRGFVHLTTDTVNAADPDINKFAFTQISDADVLSAQTQAGVVSNSDMGVPANTQFTLDWYLVGNYYYGGAPDDLTLAAAADSTDTPNFKVVDVVVTWTDIDGSTQEHRLRTVIDGYAPQFTARYGNTTIGSDPPIIPYTPEAAPDVVPVTLDIGGKKKESSKPVPDVSKKGDSTTVRFETVTYDNVDLVNNVADTVKREEFLTAKCLCMNGSSANNPEVIKGVIDWDNELKELKDTTVVVDKSGSPILDTDVDNSGGELQAAECSICCRDGANVGGGFKACRLKRIDGVLRIVDAWKMIAFNVIPSSYFNNGEAGDTKNSLAAMGVAGTGSLQEANIARYSDYVTGVVRSALATIESGGSRASNYAGLGVDTNFNSYSDVNDYDTDGVNHRALTEETSSLSSILSAIAGYTEPTSNRKQMQVRAVYLDLPPEGIYESGTYTYADVPLDRIPFFENNFTQVAGWIPDVNVGRNGSGVGDQLFDADYTDNHDDLDGSDCINDDDPNTGRNFVTNEDFFYLSGGTSTDCALIASRGMFYPFVSTSEAVSTIMFTGNDGIVDFNVTGESTVTDTITLEITP